MTASDAPSPDRDGEPFNVGPGARRKRAGGDQQPGSGLMRSRRRHNHEEVLAVLREARCTLACDLWGRPIISFVGQSGRETYYISEAEDPVRVLVNDRLHFLLENGREPVAPTGQAVREALSMLRARARRLPGQNYQPRAVTVGNTRYVDLADGRLMRVTERGAVVTPRQSERHPRDPAVTLVQQPGMACLPVLDPAQRAAAWATFRDVICAGLSDDDFKRVVFVMLAVWRSGSPAPLLVLTGLGGVGKTAIAKTIKAVTDPSLSQLCTLAMESGYDDVAAVLQSAPRCVVLDNQGASLTPDISNLLCIYCTGGAVAARDHYRWDAVKLAMQGVAIITAVESPVTAQDLLSRTIEIQVGPPPGGILPEDEMEALIVSIVPGLLACLADGVSAELRNEGKTYAGLGRLAAFERGSLAAAEAFGWSDEEVAALFRLGQNELRQRADSDTTLFNLVIDQVAAQQEPDGLVLAQPLALTLTGWLNEWTRSRPYLRDRAAVFPLSPKALGGELRRLEPTLREQGIKVERHHHYRRGDLVSFHREPPAGATAEAPAGLPPELPCPGCGGGHWWRDRTTRQMDGRWRCRTCEALPMVVEDLEEWPPPAPAMH